MKNRRAYEIAFTEAHERELAANLFNMAVDNLDPREFVALVDTVSFGDYPAAAKKVAAEIRSVSEC